MRLLATILLLLHLACAVTDRPGDDVPDAATTSKSSWELPALIECNNMCEFYWRLGCQHTSSTAWLAGCRSSCYGAAYAYPDCQLQHAIVDQCRYTVGPLPLYPVWRGDGDRHVCGGGWPYLTRPTTPGVQDNCDAAEGAWRACAYDPQEAL